MSLLPHLLRRFHPKADVASVIVYKCDKDKYCERWYSWLQEINVSAPDKRAAQTLLHSCFFPKPVIKNVVILQFSPHFKGMLLTFNFSFHSDQTN